MKKISMLNPIVEIDGDEMTRVMWHWVKERLIEPYVELKVEYYDLGIKVRDETNDEVTIRAAEAIKRWGVGAKCATITPNAERVKEYNLKKEWRSPNATIREILDGTIFRAPILVKNITPAVRFWSKPIVVARHAFGDIYSGVGLKFDEPGEVELVYRSKSGKEVKLKLPKLVGSGVLQAYYNLDKSIESFARSVFKYALLNSLDVWFAAKETISKVYDARFKEIFYKVYEGEFKEGFERRGLKYEYYLIDDAYSRAMRSEGGFVWATKNYDGDVISDMVASAFSGSLALMTSELMSPEGYYMSEAAHGTVQRHYYRYLKGEKTSTNPTAIIFTWSRALRRRGELDGISDLVKFAETLEEATKFTIEDGMVTQDVARVCEGPVKAVLTTEDFIDAVKRNLEKLISSRL
ncbi:MAG: NADP-dependent isocitrate dehydrogenase [Candidatus Nezhaarchaeota archaeon]|nr:NADP-dependent isocitrate dehydrogenase [Candidatus Nezhaarchaeota archaeon]MCX8141177.1 NADP-dependent isocitrate dehydrogenase [Candidatus Nezhaarchaeota archaeon]MDW8050820.1 NADP-dependent isocitrate dehydrogenase [Nitrososphaerota archaeon]